MEAAPTATTELQSCPPAPSLATATDRIRRKRGPSLSRRIGQTGNVFQHGYKHNAGWNPKANAYGRYWVDTPECRKRHSVSLGVCPTRTVARRKLRDHIQQEGINDKALFTASTSPATTFGEQAERWIAGLPTRRRKPVKPATVFGWRHALDKWVLPTIGDMPLSEVSNAAMKLLIDTMAAGGLAAKTIVSYSLVVKMVVASAVNADGDEIYPRRWNHDFVGMPIVQKEKQPRPAFTEVEVNSILSAAPPRYAPLFALLAGTGLRIGEALALKHEDLSPDCRVLHVRRSVWHGKEQDPKTPAAVRDVDISEPLAGLLREYAADKPGLLFPTRKGNRPLAQRNVLRALHDAGAQAGFHAFRRFRTQTLRRARVPEDLIGFWLGHARRTVTDLYAAGLQQDEAWRQEWAGKVGLGFSLNGLRWATASVPLAKAQAA